MALQPTMIDIEDLEHLDPLIDVMEACTAVGRGWINVQPEVEPEHLPPPASLLQHLMRRNSPDIALGTWTPPSAARTGEPQHLGVQHRHGARLIPLLDEFRVERPETWRRVQDSPRRGLVVDVPHDTPHAEVASWLLRLVEAATPLPTTGRWIVAHHAGR